MKKLIFILTGLIIMSAINAQSLDEIIKRYTTANKLDKISSFKTIKITGNMSMMGSTLPMTMWMKNPNKIKTVTTFNGKDMVQVYDGVKGYTINPMTGSMARKAMSNDEIRQTIMGNMFQNFLVSYLKNGQLALAGDDKVKDKPAFKLKATLEGGTGLDFFIDKSSYLLVKITSTITQNGQTIKVDTYMEDFRDTNGILIPMKTRTTAQGMEFTMNFTQVQIDTPMDDSIFKVD